MLTTSLHKCPSCGHGVELFSDEMSAKCRQCGERVSRETTPTCVAWCASARECLGEERWKALTGRAEGDAEGSEERGDGGESSSEERSS